MHSADHVVCLSITLRYCVETAEHIIEFFYTVNSHTILVFPHQMLLQYSDGGGEGASNAGWCEIIAIFDQYIALSQKLYKIGI